MDGLEILAARGKSLAGVASVASFFFSRIDAMVDPILEKLSMGSDPSAKIASKLQGELAIASAKVAYQIYQSLFIEDRFRKLANQGAHTQRLLWACTGTKNPKYSDVKYVEALIGPETINTIPLETLNAYRDHGNPIPRLDNNVEKAHQVLEDLNRVGIDLDKLTQELEDDGVIKFNIAFDRVMTTIDEKKASIFN